MRRKQDEKWPREKHKKNKNLGDLKFN